MKKIKNEITIEIKKSIPVKRITDLLCCGLEGGIIYWVKKIKAKKGMSNEDLYDIKRENWGIIIIDEDNKEHTLTIESLKKGIQLMANDADYHFNNFVKENEDAETGDVFIQMCCFNEIIYG